MKGNCLPRLEETWRIEEESEQSSSSALRSCLDLILHYTMEHFFLVIIF